VIGAETFMLVFRLIHILAGMVWLGAASLIVLFVAPAVAEVGPAAGPLISNLVLKRRVTRFVVGSGAVTVLAGAVLYWKDVELSGSFADFVGSNFGLAMTIGGIAALLALAIGLTIVSPGMERAVRTAGELGRQAGPEAPEQAERLRAMQVRVRRASRTAVALIAIAAAAMSTARYW
jgi:uncharacterized membrane protein